MIIYMAEKLKDADDLKLESMFRSDPIPDDGFSARIVSRVRRRIWVQRLTLPVAIAIGASIAAKPLLQLAGFLPQLVSVFPRQMLENAGSPIEGLMQTPVVLLGVMLAGAFLMISRMLEE